MTILNILRVKQVLLNAPNNIFVNKLPPKATIINKKPYYINKKILIKN